MREELISVIIPIYKTEQYLRKCIESILQQTYTNLELVLVNDGSPDNSLQVCMEYAKREVRITVVNKQNGGLSSARNAGLSVAKGEYVTFVDSDDYLELNAIEVLYDTLKRNNADIVCMNSIIVDSNYKRISAEQEMTNKEEVYNAETYLRKMCQREVSCSVWDKLFVKSILEKVRFIEGRLNEDFLFISELLFRHSPKIVKIDFCGYNYYTRDNSISRGGFSKSLKDAVYNTMEMQQIAEKHMPQLVPYYGAYAVYQARTALVLMTSKQYNIEYDFVAFCKSVIGKNGQYISKSNMDVKDKIFCNLYLICPRFALVLARCFRRIKK